MKNSFFRTLLEKSNIGFAYHKIIRNKEGKPYDYKCLKANDVFCLGISLKEDSIVGKHLSFFDDKFRKLIIKLNAMVIQNNTLDYYLGEGEHGYRLLAAVMKKNYVAIFLLNETISSKKMFEDRERLEILMEATNEGVYGIDINGKCTFCNSNCLRLLGYSNTDELIGKDMNKIMHQHFYGESPGFINDIVDRLFSDKQKRAEHEVFLRNDGTYFFAEYNYHPIFHNGKATGAVITFMDITVRMAFEHELKESERSKTVLLENLPGMAYRCRFDPEWTMLFVSQGCFELTGYRPSSILNNKEISYAEIIKSEYKQFVWDKWHEIIGKKEHFNEEYIIVTASGEEKWVLERGQFIYSSDNEIEAIEGLVIDISEQKAKQKEIEYLSFHDPLTGIHNRVFFEQEKKRLNKPQFHPISLIIGDINGLKLINDALGHREGDALIIRTSNVLRGCCKDKYVLARTGGDEFSILMPNTDSYHAHTLLKKIRRAFEEYNRSTYNESFHINVALGFATKTRTDESYSTISKVAEDYMYKRKLLERKSSHSAIISSIKSTVYARSQETEEHAERMQKLSRLVGIRVNLTEMELDELSLLAALHDIGKIGIDDNILKKPDKLTPDEWLEMKKHPEIGYRIAMAAPELMSIANYILCHHERWDGKGYPQGLRGTQIPLLARIIAVIDAYDAMTQDRPYRKAMSKEAALKEITDNAGTQFDPEHARIFVDLMSE